MIPGLKKFRPIIKEYERYEKNKLKDRIRKVGYMAVYFPIGNSWRVTCCRYEEEFFIPTKDIYKWIKIKEKELEVYKN